MEGDKKVEESKDLIRKINKIRKRLNKENSIFVIEKTYDTALERFKNKYRETYLSLDDKNFYNLKELCKECNNCKKCDKYSNCGNFDIYDDKKKKKNIDTKMDFFIGRIKAIWNIDIKKDIEYLDKILNNLNKSEKKSTEIRKYKKKVYDEFLLLKIMHYCQIEYANDKLFIHLLNVKFDNESQYIETLYIIKKFVMKQIEWESKHFNQVNPQIEIDKFYQCIYFLSFQAITFLTEFLEDIILNEYNYNKALYLDKFSDAIVSDTYLSFFTLKDSEKSIEDQIGLIDLEKRSCDNVLLVVYFKSLLMGLNNLVGLALNIFAEKNEDILIGKGKHIRALFPERYIKISGIKGFIKENLDKLVYFIYGENEDYERYKRQIKTNEENGQYKKIILDIVGEKTKTVSNLYVVVAVILWQNKSNQKYKHDCLGASQLSIWQIIKGEKEDDRIYKLFLRATFFKLYFRLFRISYGINNEGRNVFDAFGDIYWQVLLGLKRYYMLNTAYIPEMPQKLFENNETSLLDKLILELLKNRKFLHETIKKTALEKNGISKNLNCYWRNSFDNKNHNLDRYLKDKFIMKNIMG